MSEEGLWGIDPLTNEPTFILYSDLEESAKWELFKPVGGFCYPVEQFVSMDLPDVPFYVKDWLPKLGKAMFYAPAKTGKSYTALQLARCIGSGLPFLGLPTEQGKVLLLQFEMGPAVLQRRVRSTGKSYPNVFVGTSFSLKIDTTAGQRILWAALEAIQPQVLILDPLYKILSGDENEAKDMSAVVDVIDKALDFSREDELSVIVMHHAGKDISRGGRGSSVLEDWVDSSIEMKKTSPPGEPLRVTITPKVLRHALDPPEGLKVELGQDFEFVVVPETETIKEQVLQYLKLAHDTGSGRVQRGDILGAGIGSNGSVQDALNALCEEKVVERVGRGVYSWAKEE